MFATHYRAKFPEAVEKTTDDEDELQAFHDFPTEYRMHPRPTNPVESTVATTRLRTEDAKGADGRPAGRATVSRLVGSAPDRWHAVNAPHLVALVRAGGRCERGLLVAPDPVVAA